MKNKHYILTAALMLLGIISYAQTDGTDESVKLNQYGQPVESVGLNSEFRSGILTFESNDGDYKLWFDNRVSFDGGVFFDDDAFNPIGNGVTIRRARIAVKTILHKNWYGEIDIGFANAEVDLNDAYIKYTTDSGIFNIKAGHFRESFSMETTTTSRYVTFIERSLPSDFAPSRQLGIQANYLTKKVLLSGGLHFNTVGSADDADNSEDARRDFGTDEGYSLTGRAVYRPIIDDEKVLHFGFAASFRTPTTDLDTPDSFRFRTRSISDINRRRYLDTGDILNVENMTLYGGELAGAYKKFMFQAEYIGTNIFRDGGLENVNLNGGYGQIGYLLGDGNYRYNTKEGEFTQPGRGKNGSVFELAFRYDYLDLNDASPGIFGGEAEAYTLGLNFYPNANIRLSANYSYLNHDRHSNGNGNLFVGTDSSGNLTTNAADVTEGEGDAGDDFGQLQFRIEIDF